MDFVCLAAGRGSRMGRLGSYLQKCMYPIDLKPFVEHTLVQLLAALSRLGDETGEGGEAPCPVRLVLVVGHHARQVQDYFGPEFEGIEIDYVWQPRQLGTGDALALVRGELEPRRSIVAWQGDLFVTAPMFEAVLRHPGANVVTLGPGDPGEPPELLATASGDRVRRVWNGEGPLYDIGLWKLSPQVLSRIGEVVAPGGEVRMLPNLQRCIDDGTDVGFVRAHEWIHLGGTLPSVEENVREVVEKVRSWSADGPRESV